MIATFCLLSMVNTLTKPETIDPILINMNEVTVVKPKVKRTSSDQQPSLVLMGGKQYLVRESVQEIHDKCLK